MFNIIVEILRKSSFYIIIIEAFLISRQHGRVVKATDSKSVGISRAGSNPAAVVL